MPDVKFKGVPLFMNGQDYIIPSLSLKQVEDNYDLLASAGAALKTATIVDTFKTYIPVIAMAVRRNYPDVTEANLWEWLDLSNFSDALIIVQTRSGFQPQKMGEAEPVASIGAGSTAR